jgi:uncharacterized protein (TIGR00288 family)
LTPWWLRPTAEGASNEENNQQNSKPQDPSLASPAHAAASSSEESEPQRATTSPFLDEASEKASIAYHSPIDSAGPAVPEERPEAPEKSEWPRWEPARQDDPAAPVASAIDVFAPLDPADEEPAVEGEENGNEVEEVDEEGKPTRKRRSRRGRGGRRKNGRTATATDAPAETEEEDEPAEEPAAAGPHRVVRSAEPAAPPRQARDTFILPHSELDYGNREIVISVPERQRSIQDERKIALFCDFENIALGVRDSEIGKFDINLVLERLLEKGRIIVKKAYADWERYSDYKRPFHEAAIELIDIPQKYYSGKNSADIKMVVDAMDMSYAKEHLDTFVILSGDSDFSPLVSKLKENNKYVIGIGVKNSSSNLLVDNCDEFIYYEDVWRDAKAGPKLDGLSKKTNEAFSLMVDSIQALVRENKDVLWGSMIKQTMQRKKPSFNEGYYGYSTFSELLEDAAKKNIVKLKKDQRSGTYIVTGFAKTTSAPEPGRRST